MSSSPFPFQTNGFVCDFPKSTIRSTAVQCIPHTRRWNEILFDYNQQWYNNYKLNDEYKLLIRRKIYSVEANEQKSQVSTIKYILMVVIQRLLLSLFFFGFALCISFCLLPLYLHRSNSFHPPRPIPRARALFPSSIE